MFHSFSRISSNFLVGNISCSTWRLFCTVSFFDINQIQEETIAVVRVYGIHFVGDLSWLCGTTCRSCNNHNKQRPRERERYESTAIRNTTVVITDVRDMVECGDGGGPGPSVRIQPPPPSSWCNGRVRICTHYHYVTTAHTHATTITTRDMVQDSSFDDINKTNCNNNNDTTKFP